MQGANNDIMLGIIRSKLLHFINRREKAYQSIVNKGQTVPDYSSKISAINDLRVQLKASEGWSLESNLNWIHAMNDKLIKILPSEFNDDPKQKRYRKHMLDLVSYCEDLFNSKPMFQNLIPTTMPEKIVKVKSTVLPARFGCSEDYFNAHIKDQDLTVLWATHEFMGVKDGTGEEWSVPKSFIENYPDHRTVGQEQTFGRRAS
jgi:hypothetical protein